MDSSVKQASSPHWLHPRLPCRSSREHCNVNHSPSLLIRVAGSDSFSAAIVIVLHYPPKHVVLRGEMSIAGKPSSAGAGTTCGSCGPFVASAAAVAASIHVCPDHTQGHSSVTHRSDPQTSDTLAVRPSRRIVEIGGFYEARHALDAAQGRM